jgi:hypothetical protein
MVHMFVKLYARSDAPWNVRVTLSLVPGLTMSKEPFGFDIQSPKSLTADESEGSTLVREPAVVMEVRRRCAASSFGATGRKGEKG